MPWYAAPPAASMAPTSPASTILGIRSCHTIAWSMAGVLVWKCRSGTCASSVPRTCDGGTATGPTQTATRLMAIMMTAATSMGTTVRRTPGPRAGPGGVAAVRTGRGGAVAVTGARSRLPAHRMLLHFRGHLPEQDHDPWPPA